MTAPDREMIAAGFGRLNRALAVRPAKPPETGAAPAGPGAQSVAGLGLA